MRTASAFLVVFLSSACHHVSDGAFGLFGGGAQGPDLVGLARFQDVDGDGLAGAGDRVVLRFGAPIAVHDGSVAPAELYVDGDQWGTGAILEAGPGADELSIVLGSDAVLRARGTFATTSGGLHSPSGCRLANIPPDAIEHATTGADVSDTEWVDLVPEPVARSAGGLAPNARSVVSEDLDRDGRSDWVTADGTGAVDFHETLDGVTFLRTSFPLAGARLVRAIDRRGVGLVDVVAVTDAGLAFFTNTSDPGGSLSFVVGDEIAVAPLIRDARALDVEGDGDQDLALLTADGVRLLVNLGSGAFEDLSAPLAGSPSDGRVLAAGDVDGDATLDLVVGRDGTEVLLRNAGCGAFAAPEDVAGQGSTADLVLVDLDRDGDLDALGAGDAGLRVWLGSQGVLVPALELPGAAQVVRARDLDGDAAPDVLLGGADALRLLWNRGDATLADGGARLGAGQAVVDLAAGEVELDSDLDLLIVGAGGPSLAHGSLSGVWGTTRLRRSSSDVGSGHLFSLATGDMDGDGDADLITGRNSTIEVHFNLGGGDFDPQAAIVDLGTARAHGLALADVDRDGDLDLLAAILGSAPGVWLNDGTGQLAAGEGGGSFQEALSIAAGDLDGDGDVDFVLGRVGGRQNLVVRNLGNDCAGGGAWLGYDAPTALPDTLHTPAVALADLDRDGDLDALFAHGGDNSDRIYWNDGQGSLTEGAEDFGAEDTRAIAVGDLDRDGDLDLVFGKPFEDAIWHNDGAGQFALVAQLGPGATFDVALTDLDGDGWLDLIEGRELSQGLHVHFGDPTGTFADGPRSRSLDQNVRRLRVLDVDLDGAPDFVAGMEDDAANRLWRNL